MLVRLEPTIIERLNPACVPTAPPSLVSYKEIRITYSFTLSCGLQMNMLFYHCRVYKSRINTQIMLECWTNFCKC